MKNQLKAGAVISYLNLLVGNILRRKIPFIRKSLIPTSLLGGLLILVFGARFFVGSASFIAAKLGVPEAIIGLTVVAFGTSLPELATSVVAALKKEQDIAIGNVVGSNVFNILCIMGITPLIKPITARGISMVDMAVMMFVAALLFFMMLCGKKLNRIEGVLLLAINFIYVGFLVYKVL